MRAFIHSEEAQGLVEYALILVLVAVAVILILTTFGEEITVLYELITAMDPFE
jgi:pilus assembly protein Flp/PilA